MSPRIERQCLSQVPGNNNTWSSSPSSSSSESRKKETNRENIFRENDSPPHDEAQQCTSGAESTFVGVMTVVIFTSLSYTVGIFQIRKIIGAQAPYETSTMNSELTNVWNNRTIICLFIAAIVWDCSNPQRPHQNHSFWDHKLQMTIGLSFGAISSISDTNAKALRLAVEHRMEGLDDTFAAVTVSARSLCATIKTHFPTIYSLIWNTAAFIIDGARSILGLVCCRAWNMFLEEVTLLFGKDGNVAKFDNESLGDSHLLYNEEDNDTSLKNLEKALIALSVCALVFNLIPPSTVNNPKRKRKRRHANVNTATRNGSSRRSSRDGRSTRSNTTGWTDQSTSTTETPSSSRHSRKLTGKRKVVMRDSTDIPPPSQWPHRPVLLCTNTPTTLHNSNIPQPTPPLEALPLGIPFEFETDQFIGKALIRLRNHSDNPSGDAVYFHGKKRIFQAVVQGKFKYSVPVSDVLTGHEFVRPLVNLPARLLLQSVNSLLTRLAPGILVDMFSNQPSALAILAASSQTVNVSKEGEEPDMELPEIPEDTSIMFRNDIGENTLSSKKRKWYFANPESARRHMYDTESVHTFDFYDSFFDASSYSLDLGFCKLGVHQYLDGQPIQVMSKCITEQNNQNQNKNHYLWNFQIWNEKLLS